ncbi:MAG: hypothetical protein M3Z17_10115 [Gemmatimonadota bacterium]|nr:hypothetical protein [Gemmatimonadota bacterium]
MNITTVKVALFIAGAIVIGAGMRSDNATVRWLGIGIFVLAFLLRFLKKDVPE